jgi:hypothetical protein
LEAPYELQRGEREVLYTSVLLLMRPI